MRRSFLVLQGTASPFFSRLADALRSRGHRVRRINFCGGDLAYAGSGMASDYAAHPDELAAWYASLLRTGDVTDVILFGDCRAIHRPVHAAARDYGVTVHVFEEGYVRPHWLTLERHGVNGRSLLSRDPAWYRDRRSVTPPRDLGQATGYRLAVRAYHDMRYRAANTLYRARFPNYRSHRPRNGFVEYAGLAARALKQPLFEREAAQVTRRLLAGRPYYLFPLQVNADAQIVHHSPFNGVRESIDLVLQSFAEHAPDGHDLLIKNHPLDTGQFDYRSHVRQLACTLGIAERVSFIDAGHLPTLLDHTRGVVLVNSTTGMSALYHHCPLIALGVAIYDIPGLAWQGGLDSFWEHAERPDEALFQVFLDYVIHHTQINGDFYTDTGIGMAVTGAVRRLEAASVEVSHAFA
ncbi:capsular biosynthesis protein [Burkholderia sp. Ac-20384]|uniref:capsule biosynthesis protein n=1 Tax=Burkholderia sp. Ac-20384 TaxID=2703902 RepID=UPI001981452C|nr:capsular biosynthesis protein [Burkholderia sp. Ac-20384]MBN3823115.1 capsular biosynthesis protein [Burkholderia sp. Ac-20384]